MSIEYTDTNLLYTYYIIVFAIFGVNYNIYRPVPRDGIVENSRIALARV